MGAKHKKSEIGLTVIVLFIVAAMFFAWVFNVSQRECSTNKDCGSESYCGSDFSCHQYPIIQKTVVQYNFFVPSIIIGIAIIIAAVIFRWNSSKEAQPHAAEEPESIKVPEEAEETPKPYYSSNGNIKAP